MKIFIDARLYGLEHAGLGRYTLKLVSELTKIDRLNEYIILLRKKYFDSLDFPSNWKKVKGEFKHYTLKEQIILPQILAKEKPDIVHFLHFNIPTLYKGKFVVTIHDLLMQGHRGIGATTLPLYYYIPKQIGARFIFKKAIENSTRIIVPSLSVKKEVLAYFNVEKNKVVVTYEGVDSVYFRTKPRVDVFKKFGIKSPYFVYTGNAYPHKNLEKAIVAVISLNKKTVTLRDKQKVIFVIVTARSIFLDKLRESVRDLNAEKYVKLLGFVDDTDLVSLYKNAKGFIFPSLSEGFGLPGLEAMAGGSISLVSDIPVFREIYKDKALYFDPHEVISIEECLKKALVLDTKKREKMIKEGKKLAKTYSWLKMAKETLKVYEEI